MKTFKKYIFIALLVPFFTGVNHALSIELSKGVLQEFGMSFTAEQRLALPKVTKTIDAFESTGDVMSLAFVNVSGTDEWYRLFDNIKLYGVNVKEEKLLGAWPLTPWSYRFKMQGEGVSWEVQKGLQGAYSIRSEEHTSELQSRPHLVCRLLLE